MRKHVIWLIFHVGAFSFCAGIFLERLYDVPVFLLRYDALFLVLGYALLSLWAAWARWDRMRKLPTW